MGITDVFHTDDPLPWDDLWGSIDVSDRAYLSQPRNFPTERCAWCQRYLHSPFVVITPQDLELPNKRKQAAHLAALKLRGGKAGCVTWCWKLTMPFGKHKGEYIEDVPKSYLVWFYGRHHVELKERRAKGERPTELGTLVDAIGELLGYPA